MSIDQASPVTEELAPTTAAHIAEIEAHAAHNYHPLDVVIATASGAWVTDVEGKRYLDCLAAYSAVNLGHGHPDVLAAAHTQLDRVTLTSRAFHHDQMAAFVTELAAPPPQAAAKPGEANLARHLSYDTGWQPNPGRSGRD